MNVILIEDEAPAMEKLERYILKHDNSITIVERFTSVSETISWLTKNPNGFDLAFMDIQLTDGLSFEVFNKVAVSKPIIFTTAFDEYAIDAFKVNSIDYILKPITFTEVSNAIVKYKSIKNTYSNSTNVSKVVQEIAEKRFKERFLVRLGNHIHSIKAEEVSFFYAEGRTVFLVTHSNKKFILDYTLEDLHSLLNHSMFFRTNRTFIININAIKDVIVYSNSRLKIDLKVKTDKDIIVSREKVSPFKKWFEGN